MCVREARIIERMDAGRGRVEVRDLHHAGTEVAALGLDSDRLMAQVHAIAPGGRVLRGLAAFREVYDALGYGWLWAPTGWPVLRPICDMLYRLFARYRVRIGKLLGRRDCAGGACDPASAGGRGAP